MWKLHTGNLPVWVKSIELYEMYEIYNREREARETARKEHVVLIYDKKT